MMYCDIAVIGGGPAELVAALAARKAGTGRVCAGLDDASANLRTSSSGAGRLCAGMGIALANLRTSSSEAGRLRAGMGIASANLRRSSIGAGRVRAGMGRCQAGFCSPRVKEILARELGVPMEQIRKNEPGSELLVGRLGEVRA